MNYYPHHIGDYLRDTAHLTALEDGIYRRMLDVYYASEKPLPLDIQWVSKLVRAHTQEEQEAVKEILRQFFQKYEDGWRNKRADEEIKVLNKRLRAWKANGKKGGRPKTNGFHLANPAVTTTENPSESSQTPNTKHQTPKEKHSAFALPEWVPQDAWKAWLEVRSRVKAPNTQRALSLALNELEKLRGDGCDPRAVLEAATVKGWRGLYPVKPNGQPAGEVI